jgi:hypothetical protein
MSRGCRDVCLRSTGNVCPYNLRSNCRTFASLRLPAKISTRSPHGKVVEMSGFRGSGGGPSVGRRQRFTARRFFHRTFVIGACVARTRRTLGLEISIVCEIVSSIERSNRLPNARKLATGALGIRAFRANCARCGGVLLNERPTREGFTMRGVMAARLMDSCTPREGILCAENCPHKSIHSSAK